MKGFSIKDIRKESENEDDPNVFSLLKSKTDSEAENGKNGRVELIRNVLLNHLFDKRMIIILATIFLLISYFLALELGGMYLVIVGMIYTFTFYYPQIKEKHSYSDLNQELPYALRACTIR